MTANLWSAYPLSKIKSLFYINAPVQTFPPVNFNDEVIERIQKERGSFSKLRSVWLSKSLRNGTKIRIFNLLALELFF